MDVTSSKNFVGSIRQSLRIMAASAERCGYQDDPTYLGLSDLMQRTADELAAVNSVYGKAETEGGV